MSGADLARIGAELTGFVAQDPGLHRVGVAVATGDGRQLFWPFPAECADDAQAAIEYLLCEIHEVRVLEPQVLCFVTPILPASIEQTPLSPLTVEDGPVLPPPADPVRSESYDLLCCLVMVNGQFGQMLIEVERDEQGVPFVETAVNLPDGHRHYVTQLAGGFSDEHFLMHLFADMSDGLGLIGRNAAMEAHAAL